MRRVPGRVHNGKPAVYHGAGYVKVWEPDHPKAKSGWVIEHKLVVEAALGRYLDSKEHVHHINGDKADNRLENLQVMGAGEHSSLTGKERAERNRKQKAFILQELEELKEYRQRYGPL